MDSAIGRVPSGFPVWVAYFHVYGGGFARLGLYYCSALDSPGTPSLLLRRLLKFDPFGYVLAA